MLSFPLVFSPLNSLLPKHIQQSKMSSNEDVGECSMIQWLGVDGHSKLSVPDIHKLNLEHDELACKQLTGQPRISWDFEQGSLHLQFLYAISYTIPPYCGCCTSAVRQVCWPSAS